MLATTTQIMTQPATEPVSIDIVRRHCRVDDSSEDTLLKMYQTTARAMVEMYLSRALIIQTVLWTLRPQTSLRRWGSFLHHVLYLPRAPVQSIKSVTALDIDGNATAVPAAALPVTAPDQLAGYIADTSFDPSRLRIGPETVLAGGLTLRSTDLENVQVQFVAGYGTDGSAVPSPIINAILLTTAFLYENRGDAGGELPAAAQWLLDPYRIMFVA